MVRSLQTSLTCFATVLNSYQANGNRVIIWSTCYSKPTSQRASASRTTGLVIGSLRSRYDIVGLVQGYCGLTQNNHLHTSPARIFTCRKRLSHVGQHHPRHVFILFVSIEWQRQQQIQCANATTRSHLPHRAPIHTLTTRIRITTSIPHFPRAEASAETDTITKTLREAHRSEATFNETFHVRQQR